eukprot:CAMPEP_0116941882 /NCGR_PEP_ID=MMETSP0467-20121206/34257_1 /TAXON_ID=283647 /ORGANISM="Mesodinium pulex, Strain SPMC105" /LENGTH=53 /DNA_ID=CAMNT_0004624759 /DNA_START=348 /DNA_END=509 /DNA_ORIENTATION=-
MSPTNRASLFGDQSVSMIQNQLEADSYLDIEVRSSYEDNLFPIQEKCNPDKDT